ncbi:MAG TPA: PKD domain-containing protein [Bacteroidales bacterium]|nr:PKD domain-containing protein [Bacteroidales bacterium]
MKKIIFALFLFLSLGAWAQLTVSVSGHVTNQQTGAPVPNHVVMAQLTVGNDSLSGVAMAVPTDGQGFYAAVLTAEGLSGILEVSTISCDGVLLSDTVQVSANTPSFYIFDFAVNCQPLECQAMFSYYMVDNMTVQFQNESVGQGLTYLWNFGDGSTSAEMHPQKTYAAGGMYEVSLLAAKADSSCASTYTFTVFVGESPLECSAMFYYVPQANSLNTISFIDISFGNPTSWVWDFGDGITAAEQNPVHSYVANGTYMVTLSIANPETQCQSAITMPVFVGDSIISGCMAMFDYYPGSAPNEIMFLDKSFGAGISSWSWDFGDNTVSNEQNPVHQYNQNGMYMVTLSIADQANQCANSITLPVFVGDSIITGCMAMFGYYPGANTSELVFVDKSFGDNISSWSWDFGDNTVSNEQNPVHQYNSPGVYPVSLTIQNADGSCFNTYSEMVYVGANAGCYAMFEALLVPGFNTAFMFQNFSSGSFTSCHWDFGDGNSSTEFSPTHEFANPGFYDVCLSISSGDSSCFSSYCMTVMAGGSTGCMAKFAYYPDTLNGQSGLQFMDMSLGQIESRYWDFGDGQSSDETNPLHVYAASGIYNVCLTVTGSDASGTTCTSTWCENVYVGNVSNCFNYFIYSVAGNTVQFQGFHSTDVPASYQWDFGTGVATLGNPVTYVYPGPGIYYVKLTSWDDNNCMASSAQTIVVGDTMAFNQVYGQVFEGTFPTPGGNTIIFSLGQDSLYLPYAALAPITEAGVYMFPFVPNGTFTILAMPVSANGYLPTYYGNTIFWEEALQVVPGQTSNPYNISLVQANTGAGVGNGTISGIINYGGNGAMFVDKIIVYLTNASHQVIAYKHVDSNGNFAFTGLATGTYYLYPELAGVNSDYMQVNLTDLQPEMVYNMSFSGNNFLGTSEIPDSFFVREPYPNPANDQLNLDINRSDGGQIRVNILDISGRLIMKHTETLGAGINKLSLPVSQLEKGMYLVQFMDESGRQISRRFIKN